MDDAVMKKSFNPSFPVSFRWTKYVFHNVDHSVDITTDIVLLCELNPPMLVNWSNQQKTAKTDSVERMPQSGWCPLPVVAGEGLGDGPNWSWSGTLNTGSSATRVR